MVLRMDNVLINVDDLEAARAFFLALGLETEGSTTVEGPWVDKVLGLHDVRAEIVLLRTPDGSGKVELSRFHNPPAVKGASATAPSNTLGMRRIMFAVDDVEACVARLLKTGAHLVGEVADYDAVYRLCFVRGPEGIMVGLAEELR